MKGNRTRHSAAFKAQGDILERNAYYPFGLQMNQGKAYPTLMERLPQLYSGYISPTPARRNLYNGKEIQTAAGTDYIDYGFRQFDPTIARWFNIDPKAEKYFEQTSFNYCHNNPLIYIDPLGMKVLAVYSKKTNQLALIQDENKFNPNVSSKTISAESYLILSEQELKEHNYIIVVKGVFTGGHYDNKENKIVYKTNERELPISAGEYSILENKGNTKKGHEHFFVLDPVDSSPYDKVDDREGEINSYGEKRKGYNWLPGDVSHGCVTALKGDNPEKREQEWEALYRIIINTRTEEVPDRRGLKKYIPWGSQIKYGKVIITE